MSKLKTVVSKRLLLFFYMEAFDFV